MTSSSSNADPRTGPPPPQTPIVLPASSLLAEQALEQAILEMQSANRPAATVPVGIAETPQLVSTAAPVPVGIMVMPQLANTGDRNIGTLATTGNGAITMDQMVSAYAESRSRVANTAPATSTQSSAVGGESGPRSTAIPMIQAELVPQWRVSLVRRRLCPLVTAKGIAARRLESRMDPIVYPTGAMDKKAKRARLVSGMVDLSHLAR